jgi:4-hydroxy-tetrahydrodipicolinate synthase
MTTMSKPKGIIPPIGMPLTTDERIDENGLRRLVRYLLDSGVHGIFVNSSMGGFALLKDREQFCATEIVVDEVRGRVPIMAGASDTGTARVIEKAKQMQRFGVDYLTILPPYYFLLSQNSALAFYRNVSQAVEKPVIVYDNPTLVGSRLTLDTLIELSNESNIIGIKESYQDCNHWFQLLSRLRHKPNFSVLLGTEFLIPVGLLMGADGIIGGLHNIAPRLAVDAYQAVQKGETDKALELSQKLCMLAKIFDYGEIWGGFEAALQYLKICEKITAEPYFAPSSEEKSKVNTLLDSLLGSNMEPARLS